MRISDWSSDVCSSDLLAPRSLGRSRIIFPKLAARGGVERPHHAIARRGIENPVHRHRAGHRIAERQVDRPGQPQTAHRVAVDLVQRARSEEHTSELPSLMRISYDVFCLKKKNNKHYKQP